MSELRLLLERHASAGSLKAAALLELDALADEIWLVEPLRADPAAVAAPKATLAADAGRAAIQSATPPGRGPALAR